MRELERARAAEAVALEEEDEAVEQMKYSRTQLLQRRKDREDLIRLCRNDVREKESALEKQAQSVSTLAEIEAALAENGALVGSVVQVQALLKRGRDVGGLGGATTRRRAKCGACRP